LRKLISVHRHIQSLSIGYRGKVDVVPNNVVVIITNKKRVSSCGRVSLCGILSAPRSEDDQS